MGISLRKINIQDQLWTIPGPFLICCTLLMMILRPIDTPLILPITALGGVVACHIWKWRGVAFSSLFLAAIMVYSLQSQPSSSWIWIIALSLSIASAFVVSVLCSEEANQAFDMLSRDSNDHKQTLIHLNERFQTMQHKLTLEQNALNLQISQLEQQLSAKEEKQRSNEQLIRLAKDEITATFVQHEKLLQELKQTRQNNAALEVKVVELEELVNPEMAVNYGKAAVELLQNKLDASINECEITRNKINQLTIKLQEAQTSEEISYRLVIEKSDELASLQACNTAMEIRIQEIQVQHLNRIKDLTQQIENGVREKQEFEKTLLQLQEELEFSSIKELEKSQNFEKEKQAFQAMEVVFEENELKLKEKIKELEKQVFDNEIQNEKWAELRKQIDLDRSEIKRLINHCHNLELDKDSFEKLYNSTKARESVLLEKLEELSKQTQAMDHLQNEYRFVQQKLSDFQALQEENLELLQKLVHQKECVALLSVEKDQVIEKLHQLQVEQEEALKVIGDDKELRRVEGLYQQLRQQFTEKSEILSATRRELFATQEKLSVLQKDIEEAKLYEDHETSESLHHLIAEAESELALAEQQHANEINRLHEVIDSLMVRA